MIILSGDIGGTKTRLAILDIDNPTNPILERSYPSTQYGSLIEISSDFLSNQNNSVTYAAFGVAGPISGCSCKITNLPWHIDANQMEHKLRIPSVHLVNDLEATAYGVAALNDDDLHTLQIGSKDAKGNQTVIAAGTGLGQAGMFWDGEKHMPFATEGGHCDFAPSCDLECELLSTLKRGNHNVCLDDTLSGPGLVSIYSFLLDRHQQTKPDWLVNNAGDAAKIITDHANDEQDPVCAEALEIFTRLYGAEAGNLALKLMATGGVYIGGGIAPKILSWLEQPQFLEAFRNKGKMRDLMESIPVHVILNDRAALYGPALFLREKVVPD